MWALLPCAARLTGAGHTQVDVDTAPAAPPPASCSSSPKTLTASTCLSSSSQTRIPLFTLYTRVGPGLTPQRGSSQLTPTLFSLPPTPSPSNAIPCDHSSEAAKPSFTSRNLLAPSVDVRLTGAHTPAECCKGRPSLALLSRGQSVAAKQGPLMNRPLAGRRYYKRDSCKRKTIYSTINDLI